MAQRCGFRPTLLLVCAGVIALAGCASEDELSALRREQRALARRIADTRADVDGLRVTVSRLQGKIEDTSLGRRGSHATAAPIDVDERLRALEETVGQPRPAGSEGASIPGGPAVADAPGSAGGLPPVDPLVAARPVEPAPLPVPAPADELPRTVDINRDIGRGGPEPYREGLAQYQRGDYPKAIQSLRGFVNKDPKSDLVPAAHYWIAEAYFAQRRYNEAILAYNEILVAWPKSERVPATLLRQAAAFAEIGDQQDARLILQKLIADHPGTEEAASAKRKLLALGA